MINEYDRLVLSLEHTNALYLMIEAYKKADLEVLRQSTQVFKDISDKLSEVEIR